MSDCVPPGTTPADQCADAQERSPDTLSRERWHSVNDSLPRFDRPVLVVLQRWDGQPTYAFGARIYDPEGWCWGIGRPYGGIDMSRDAAWNDIEADDDYPVTHWRPIPLLRRRGQPASKAAAQVAGDKSREEK